MRHASLFLPLVLSGCAFFGLQPEEDSSSSGGDGDGDMVGDGDFIGDGDGDLSTGAAPGDGDMSTGMRPGDGDGDTGGAWMGDGDGDTGGSMSGDGDTGGTSSGGTGSGGEGSGGMGTGGSGLTPEEELAGELRRALKLNEIQRYFVEIYLDGDMPESMSLDDLTITVNGGSACSLSGLTVDETRRFAVAKTGTTTCAVEGMCSFGCPFDIELSDTVRLMAHLGGTWFEIDMEQNSEDPVTASETWSADPDGSDSFGKRINSQGTPNN